MAKPVGLLLRGLRVDLASVVSASKLVVGVGALLVAAVWVGLVDGDLPLWLRVYGGASVAVPVLHFLTRSLVPPLPRVGTAACPRCAQAVHYAGYECPGCGVLTFSHDGATHDLET